MKRAPAAVARLMLFVSLFSVLAASTARAESARHAGGRSGRVTKGALFWRTAERDALPSSD
jgi:hypothetical protein